MQYTCPQILQYIAVILSQPLLAHSYRYATNEMTAKLYVKIGLQML
jgi:hypothetical protein